MSEQAQSLWSNITAKNIMKVLAALAFLLLLASLFLPGISSPSPPSKETMRASAIRQIALTILVTEGILKRPIRAIEAANNSATTISWREKLIQLNPELNSEEKSANWTRWPGDPPGELRTHVVAASPPGSYWSPENVVPLSKLKESYPYLVLLVGLSEPAVPWDSLIDLNEETAKTFFADAKVTIIVFASGMTVHCDLPVQDVISMAKIAEYTNNPKRAELLGDWGLR